MACASLKTFKWISILLELYILMGSTPLNEVETLQRKAIRMILDVKKNTSNEILYVKSGIPKLKPTIYKRQLSFCRKFKARCD